jgi:hypothetical protein
MKGSLVNKKFFSIMAMAIGIFALTFAAVSAAVTFDPDTGTGFVGKGDVQTVYGWNNPQLQANADSVQFRVQSEIITEVSWTCTNESNQNQQVRERTTTSTVHGVVSSVERERNQVTGFYLNGYVGEPTVGSSSEGPGLNSCPSGPWSLTTPAGEPEVVSSTGGVQVSIDGNTWNNLD